MTEKEKIEEAKRLYKTANADQKYLLESLFPELFVSEDERIRKALIRYHQSTLNIDGIKGEEILAWLEKQGKQKDFAPQVDGFDAELNALLKKYEHLSKEELQEPLEFYLGVVRDDLDIVREEKPKWTDEDERIRKELHIYLDWLDGRKDYAPRGEYTIMDMIAWLKSLKQRMEERQ